MSKTREQRRARRIYTAARVLLTVALMVCLAAVFCTKAEGIHQPTAEEYLSEIGADNAQRAALMDLYGEWADA